MTLREGAAITASPTVPTAFGPCALAMRSTASTISDNAASASRRSGIGVVPAWLSKPVILPSYQMMPWPRSTTPMVLFSASSSGPCSICSSTKAPNLRAPDRLVAAIADAVERLADADAGGIAPRQNVVGGVIAGIGGRGHRRRREARAFLVGPVDDADRRFGLDPGVVEGAHHLERRQRAEHAVELAAGRLGVEMRAEADRRLRHVAALAQAEHRAERIDMHLEAGGLAGVAEPVAHLLVLGPERQPPHAALRRGAEFRGFVDRVPEPGGIDLQVGCDFGHSVFRESWCCGMSRCMVELCGTTCRGTERFFDDCRSGEERAGATEPADAPEPAARLACRAGMATTTAGVANGFVQGNLAILPEKLAASFHRFCQLNPKPCPIIGMSDVGDPRIPVARGSISTSAPTCRATGSGATARWWRSRPTSWRTGATISSPSCSAARFRSRKR